MRHLGQILYALAVWILYVVGFTDEWRARQQTASVPSTEPPDPGADPTHRLVLAPCRPQGDEAEAPDRRGLIPLGDLVVHR